MATTDSTPIGLRLKLERVAAKVRAQEVAWQMGISPSRMAKIEIAETLEPDTIARYRAGIKGAAEAKVRARDIARTIQREA